MKLTDFNGPRDEQLERIWKLPHANQISWLAADITTSIVTVNLYAEDRQLKNAIRDLAKNAGFADSQFVVLGSK
jgi:hypothetical protein